MKCDSGCHKRNAYGCYQTIAQTKHTHFTALTPKYAYLCACVYAASLSVDYELQTFSAMFIYFAPPRCAVVTAYYPLPAACCLLSLLLMCLSAHFTTRMSRLQQCVCLCACVLLISCSHLLSLALTCRDDDARTAATVAC